MKKLEHHMFQLWMLLLSYLQSWSRHVHIDFLEVKAHFESWNFWLILDYLSLNCWKYSLWYRFDLCLRIEKVLLSLKELLINLWTKNAIKILFSLSFLDHFDSIQFFPSTLLSWISYTHNIFLLFASLSSFSLIKCWR